MHFSDWGYRVEFVETFIVAEGEGVPFSLYHVPQNKRFLKLQISFLIHNQFVHITQSS
jgi:hypothetical protein